MKKLFKVVAGLVGVAAVGAAGYLAYDHFYGEDVNVDDQVMDTTEEVVEEVTEEAPIEETVETEEVKTVVDDVDTTEPEL